MTMGFKAISEEFRRLRRRYGLIALPGRVLRKTWQRLMRNKHYVSVHGHGATIFPMPDKLRIERYVREQDIPSSVLEQVTVEEGNSFVHFMRREFANHGVLWLCYMDGEIIAYQWSRVGKYIRQWFVSLSNADVLIFSTVTFPNWRGRGIGPAMMGHIIANEVHDQGVTYIDCKEWNTPAIRAIDKAGFTRIGLTNPLASR